MRLGEWLFKSGKNAADLARELDVDKSTVGRWVKGEVVPHKTTMAKIREITGGDVTANDFMASVEDRDTVNPASRPAA